MAKIPILTIFFQMDWFNHQPVIWACDNLQFSVIETSQPPVEISEDLFTGNEWLGDSSRWGPVEGKRIGHTVIQCPKYRWNIVSTMFFSHLWWVVPKRHTIQNLLQFLLVSFLCMVVHISSLVFANKSPTHSIQSGLRKICRKCIIKIKPKLQLNIPSWELTYCLKSPFMGILLGYRTICEIFLAQFLLLRPLGQAGRSSMTYVKTEDDWGPWVRSSFWPWQNGSFKTTKKTPSKGKHPVLEADSIHLFSYLKKGTM